MSDREDAYVRVARSAVRALVEPATIQEQSRARQGLKAALAAAPDVRDEEMGRLQAELADAQRVLAEELTAIGEERTATRRVDVLEVIRERDALRSELAEAKERILDIDAHATPYGDIPDDPGYVGTYLVTAGALHRALGKIGHTAPKCQAEAERDALQAHLARIVTELEAERDKTRDAEGATERDENVINGIVNGLGIALRIARGE